MANVERYDALRLPQGETKSSSVVSTDAKPFHET